MKKAIYAGLVVLGFAGSYAVTPRGIDVTYKTIETTFTANPSKYQNEILRLSDFAHEKKAELLGKAEKGYVPFRNLNLELVHTEKGDLTNLVHRTNNYKLPIQSINGKTAVGTYANRSITVYAEWKHTKPDGWLDKHNKKTVERMVDDILPFEDSYPKLNPFGEDEK